MDNSFWGCFAPSSSVNVEYLGRRAERRISMAIREGNEGKYIGRKRNKKCQKVIFFCVFGKIVVPLRAERQKGQRNHSASDEAT